jgi:hypothetical protein
MPVFDETMHRITERFACHTGVVTGLIAIAVARGLQLDSFELLREGSQWAFRSVSELELEPSQNPGYRALSDAA